MEVFSKLDVKQDWKLLSMMDRDSELRSNIIITIKILNDIQYEENTTKLKQIESFSWKVGRWPQ